jgi:cytochrome c peroxidase
MRASPLIILAVFCCCLWISGCSDSTNGPTPWQGLQPPPGFDPIPYPVDNEPTPDRIELGRLLFFDTRLSKDRTVSCASCHDPNLAFTDGRDVSIGVEGRRGTRNAPSLLNVAYHPYLLREGGVPTLEQQVLVPIQEHAEFDMNILDVVERLKEDANYGAKARQAYDREFDPWVLTRAISAFERSLLTSWSAYDRYTLQGDRRSFSAAAVRGLELFNTRAGCINCHGGRELTTHGFANNGLYDVYADPGRFRLTSKEEDRAKFKIPSLRNVALTAPYMHDGSMKSLREVVEHYNAGGRAHPNKDRLVRPLHLTESEVSDMVELLKSFTDEERR